MNPTKVCTGCQQELPRGAFKVHSSKNPHWVVGRCPPCRNAYKRARYHSVEKGLEWVLRSTVKRYGITLEEYKKMLDDCGHRCSICGTDNLGALKRLSVDHCHSSGKVRGILCGRCNTALGGFKDNVEILTKAIEYLKNTEGH